MLCSWTAHAVPSAGERCSIRAFSRGPPPRIGDDLYSRAVAGRRRAVMSKAAFLEATDRLIADGERLAAFPDWDAFRWWLISSDELLERVWGRMDRYHLAWLNVGRDSAPPGSPLDEAGQRRFIVAVADAKLAVLRTMLRSVEREASAGRVRSAQSHDQTEEP